VIDLYVFCRRDAYTVIAPDEEKRKTVQESEINFCFNILVTYCTVVANHAYCCHVNST